MIVFGCSIVSPEAYMRYAGPGIRRAQEAGSKVFALQAAGSIFRSYNLLLAQAAVLDDLEALVLVHQDTEILDTQFCVKLRRSLRDPDVGVVGCVGSVGAQSIAWWQDSTVVGSFVQRYHEFGGGEIQAFASAGKHPSLRAREGEVDTVDGLMMALSPWAVRNIRFDESLGPNWGYDFDYCQQVRAAGRKVVVADVRVAHHHPLSPVEDPEPWIAAHMRAAEKWNGRTSGANGADLDWKNRARRAEAEAVVARLEGASILLHEDAVTGQHARQMRELTDSRSWRMTEPLRRLNSWRRTIRQRRRAT
jgi:hypothetical protein